MVPTQDVTDQANWTSGDGGIATVDSGADRRGCQRSQHRTRCHHCELRCPRGITSGHGAESTAALTEGWDAARKDLILTSFIIDNGASLKVSGSAAFKVLTRGDITLHGAIDCAGTNGADVGSGKGGNGGAGGDVNFTDYLHYISTVTRGAGGHGGRGKTSGGDRGAGGNVTASHVTSSATATGSAGGLGGAPDGSSGVGGTTL